MTDEERQDAERLANSRALKNKECIDAIYLQNCIIEAYAAACEAKQVLSETCETMLREKSLLLKAERARSARLRAVLMKLATGDYSLRVLKIANEALDKYEASK